MKASLLIALNLFAALLLGAPGLSGGPRQEPTNQAGLLVQFSDNRVETFCVTFSEETISGIELLERAGLTLAAAYDPQGAAVCQIQDTGCPSDNCFCQFPPNYWSYWHAIDGAWSYAPLGAAGYRVKNGDIDGWNWSIGLPPTHLKALAEICAPTSTPADTATLAPTDTPLPTETPLPTNTPVPTETPLPTATPVQVAIQESLPAAALAASPTTAPIQPASSPTALAPSPVPDTPDPEPTINPELRATRRARRLQATVQALAVSTTPTASPDPTASVPVERLTGRGHAYALFGALSTGLLIGLGFLTLERRK